MREILTIQVGSYANFVGAHFWNFQDEILGLAEQGYEGDSVPSSDQNMDVIYRIGETRQGKATYTPRLLSIDCRGSLGSVGSSGSLYGRPPVANVKEISTWHGPAATYKSDPYERNSFLQSLDEEEERYVEKSRGNSEFSRQAKRGTGNHSNDSRIPIPINKQVNEGRQEDHDLVQSLENGVQFWTDYLKVHLHPASLYQLPWVWHESDALGNYGSGRELVTGEEESTKIQDMVRIIAEECDHLQGFQFTVDDYGGFSAVANVILEDIVEEYGPKPVCLFTVRSPYENEESSRFEKSLTRALHDAVSFSSLAPTSNLYIPVGLPHLAASGFARDLLIQDRKHYHTSAVYAVAINCATLPTRIDISGPSDSAHRYNSGSSSLEHIIQLVSCNSARRVAFMEASLPAPALPDIASQDKYDLGQLSSLTPNTELLDKEDQYGDLLVIQGAKFKSSRDSALVSTVQDILTRDATLFRRNVFGNHTAVSSCPLAIPLPFPCIFSPHVGRYGDLLPNLGGGKVQGKGGLDVVSSPVVARMSSSAAILPYMKKRLSNLEDLGLARSSLGACLLTEWGFAREEVQEFVELISGMMSAYGYGGHSDSSDSE